MPVEKTLFDVVPTPAPTPAPTPLPPPANVVVTPSPATPSITFSWPSWLTGRTLFEIALVLALVLPHVGRIHVPKVIPDATVKAPLKATVIWDADSIDPVQTGMEIRADGDLKDALKQLGCGWRNYDKADPALASTGLAKYAGDLPTLVIQVEGVAVPPIRQHVTSPAEVLAAVKKLRGVN